MKHTELALTGAPALPVYEIILPDSTKAEIELALAAGAAIGRVATLETNTACVQAMAGIKGLTNAIERARKLIKEPLIEAGRAIDRAAAGAVVELDQEFGRLSGLASEFALAERRRIREEQEAQERALAEIEVKRQAELQRIEDERLAAEREATLKRIEAERVAKQERDEAERKARAEREAAEKALRDAKSQADREAAQKAATEAEARRVAAEQEAEAKRLQADQEAANKAAEAQSRAGEQMQLVNDAADHRTQIESKPVQVTRAPWQRTVTKMKVKSLNEFQLMKARPDLVREVKFDMIEVNAALNRGETLPGVTAEPDTTVSVRGKMPRTIDV